RAAGAPGFLPRARDVQLAPHRKLGRERLAGLGECLAVELQLPLERVEPGVRVDVPGVAEPGRPAYRRVAVAGDPDRRPGGADRPQPDRHVVEPPERPLVGPPLLGPEPLDQLDAGDEAADRLAARDPERVPLDVAVADAGAQDEPPTAHHVDRRAL